tara:strand:+ start:1144 stop:1578 length:435 start_codon:yes stop_codon:yes gene_type:complete
MATTITATTLTSTIQETLTLNGQVYGNTNTHEVTSMGQSSSRVMSCGTGLTDLLNLATTDSAGTIVGDSTKYMRFTNLDDTNFITLQVHNGAASYYKIKLGAGESHLLMNNQMGIGSEVLADMSVIKGTADTLACDIEVLTITA